MAEIILVTEYHYVFAYISQLPLKLLWAEVLWLLVQGKKRISGRCPCFHSPFCAVGNDTFWDGRTTGWHWACICKLAIVGEPLKRITSPVPDCEVRKKYILSSAIEIFRFCLPLHIAYSILFYRVFSGKELNVT